MHWIRLCAVALLLLVSGVAKAASPFTYAPGTNGFTTTPFNLLSSELNALGSGVTATSSVGCTSGVCSQTNTGNAIWGSIWFVSGGAFTPVAGQALACWFLVSSDGGTTFELDVSNTQLPRAADFTIPLYNSAYASGNLAFAQGRRVLLPVESFKIKCDNLGTSATSLPATGNLIKLGPLEVQY